VVRVARGLRCPHCRRLIRASDIDINLVSLGVILICRRDNCHQNVMEVEGRG
jgi:hypothetical protein